MSEYVVLCRRLPPLLKENNQGLPTGVTIKTRADDEKLLRLIQAQAPEYAAKHPELFEEPWKREVELFLRGPAAEVLTLSGDRGSLGEYLFRLGKCLADVSEGVLLRYVLVTSPAQYSLAYTGVAAELTWEEILSRCA